MNATAIVTDSSAQLPVALAAELGVAVVPIGVIIGGEEHAETALDIDAFYDRLSGGESVSTSLPSPGRLADAYREAAARGATDVISIHLDGRVSGTVAAAQLAADDVSVNVTVIDTETVSFGVGVCVLAAARAAAAGQPPAEIEALIAQLAPGIENAFVASAPSNGRVADRTGLGLLSFVDGAARFLEPCDDLDCAVSAMTERIPADRALCIAVGHAHDLTAPPADELARRFAEMASVTDVLRYRVSPSVGAHTGPQSFGAFWWPADTARLAA